MEEEGGRRQEEGPKGELKNIINSKTCHVVINYYY